MKKVTRIPISLRAKTADDLSRLILLNQQVNDTEWEYQIIFDGKQYIAFFRADVTQWIDPMKESNE